MPRSGGAGSFHFFPRIFLRSLRVPWSAHWRINQSIGRFVISAAPGERIELDATPKLPGYLREIHERCRPVTIQLVQRKFLSRPDRFNKICDLCIRFRKGSELLFQIRNCGPESLEQFPTGTFDKRGIILLLLSFKHDPAAVSVGENNASE